MSNIPEDIKQKIDEQAKIVCTTALFAGTLIIDNFKQSVFAGGGQYGYSFALPKIEELEKKVEEQAKEIAQLKKENEDLRSFRSGISPIVYTTIPNQGTTTSIPMKCDYCGFSPHTIIKTNKGVFCQEHVKY